jgi:hypothetical protein
MNGISFSKYGYFSFKVAKRLANPWQEKYLGSIPNGIDLNSDMPSLVKWYALQLQELYPRIQYNLRTQVKIYGPNVNALIAMTLLQDNFCISDVTICERCEDVIICIDGQQVMCYLTSAQINMIIFLLMNKKM